MSSKKKGRFGSAPKNPKLVPRTSLQVKVSFSFNFIQFFGFCIGNSATFSKLFAMEIPFRPLGGNGLKLEEPN